MENSPLRFLDLDVSLMLAGEVRNSQEKEARKHHHNLYQSRPSGGWHGRHTVHYHHGIICRVLNRLRRPEFGLERASISGGPARPVKPRIILYEQELKNIMRSQPYRTRNNVNYINNETKFTLEFYYKDSNVYNFKITALVLTPLVWFCVTANIL